MLDPSYHFLFTVAVLLILFLSIYFLKARSSVLFLLATIALLIAGVLTTEEVMRGLSNEAIGTIILLILITAGIRKNFPIESWLNIILGRSKSYRIFLFRMMSQVAIVSSFVNNTPVVALLTPYIFNWGKKIGISPSKLLIPLSYATILGGMITVIGTSTTLVLNGFLMENSLATLNPAYLFYIGSAVTITGVLFITVFGNKLLPDNKDLLEKFNRDRRDYLVETELSSDSILIGKSVKEAGLRNLKGIYLVEILRDKKSISPVKPQEVIHENDRLIFTGDTEEIMGLVDGNIGIELPKHELTGKDKMDIHEVVVSVNSSIVGQTVKDCKFRERYDAGIIAVQRGGEKLEGKIGDIILRNGDLLLLITGSQFSERLDLYRDLYLINHVKEIPSISTKQLTGLGLMLASTIFFLIQGASLFFGLLFIFSIMIILQLINLRDIKRELDLELITILILSLALGKAVLDTGIGESIGKVLVSSLSPFGNIGILVGLILSATLLTSMISNVATVAIMFPVAFTISSQLSMPPEAVYLTLAYGASAAFLTPIGYQTNLIIYGPGGYSFRDFLKAGMPVTILYISVVLCMILLIFG